MNEYWLIKMFIVVVVVSFSFVWLLFSFMSIFVMSNEEVRVEVIKCHDLGFKAELHRTATDSIRDVVCVPLYENK